MPSKKKSRPKKEARRAIDIYTIRGYDEKLVAAIKRVNALAKANDVEQLHRELMTMHASRMSRVLRVKDILVNDQTRFIEATLQNDAFRSRTAEIKVIADRIYTYIEDILHTSRNYVRSQYAAEMKRHLATVDDRRSYIESLFGQENRKRAQFAALSATCDTLLNDYDQSGFTGKRIVDILTLSHTDRRVK